MSLKMITGPILARASVACLAVSSLLSLGSYLFAVQPLTSQALARQQQVLQRNQIRIAHWWDHEVANIRTDLANPKIISPSLLILSARRQNRSRIKSPLSLYLEAQLNPNAFNRKSVSLLTRGGITVFSTSQQKLGRYQPLDNTTTSLELDELPTTPLNFFTDAETGLPSISVALPVKDVNQKTRGFLAFDLNLNRLNELIRADQSLSVHTARPQPPIHAYLAARTTLEHVTLIAPPVSQATSGNKLYKFEPLDSEGIQRALNGQRGQGLYLNPSSQAVVGVFQYLPNFRSALMVESLQRDVYLSARSQARLIFGVGTIVSLCLSLASLLISHRSRDQGVIT